MATKKKLVKKQATKKASAACARAIDTYARAQGNLCDAYNEGSDSDFSQAEEFSKWARKNALTTCR